MKLTYHRYSGVFVGFACDWIVDRQWRVLLGTSSIPALILLFLVFLCPESPRFLIRKGDYTGAFVSLRQLRGTDIQAARDLYYIHSQLQVETEMFEGERPQNWYSKEIYQEKVRETNFLWRLGKLFSHPRNQRACLAAFLVMASQQLCGVSRSSLAVLIEVGNIICLIIDLDQCSFVLLFSTIQRCNHGRQESQHERFPATCEYNLA